MVSDWYDIRKQQAAYTRSIYILTKSAILQRGIKTK